MCRTNYYNDKSHGGWRKVDKNVDNCYIPPIKNEEIDGVEMIIGKRRNCLTGKD
jgi:hypothetical protein